MTDEYAFFPGCTIADRLPFIEKSIRMVAPHFGMELKDLPFTCCPEPNSVRSFSENTWLAMGARNLAVAEEAGLDILNACAGCFESLSMSKHKLDSSEKKKAVINEVLSEIGLEYKGRSKVLHMIQILFDKIGPEEIARRVVKPISMNVVTHPGCHLLRPGEILKVDDSEVPTKLDDLVRILGIEPLDYMDKTMCCGAGVRGINRDAAFAVLREKFEGMMMVNPDAAVVFCPSCFITFEAGQKVVNRMFGTSHKLPVYYYTELLAIAMELPEVDVLLGEHRVKSDIITIKEPSDVEAEVEN